MLRIAMMRGCHRAAMDNSKLLAPGENTLAVYGTVEYTLAMNPR